MDNEKILDKIQKLLSLATSNNIHESTSAAALAQKLMHKYNLTTLMVESYQGKEAEEEEIVDFTKNGEPLDFLGKKVSIWKSRLGMVISKANHCRVYINIDNKGNRCIGLIGAEKDAIMTRCLYQFLVKEIERLSLRDGKGKGKTWCNNFKLGAVVELEERLREALEESKTTLKEECEKGNIDSIHTTTALAKFTEKDSVIEEFMKNMNLKKGPKVQTNFMYSAHLAGRKAAKEINLDNQIEDLIPEPPAIGPAKPSVTFEF